MIDGEAQHDLPESQVFGKEVDCTAETGTECDTQVEIIVNDTATDPFYFELCDTTEIQVEPEVTEKEVQATDYELSINNFVLNQVEFQDAMKSDALLKVDGCISQLIASIQKCKEDNKANELNAASQVFVRDIVSIQLA